MLNLEHFLGIIFFSVTLVIYVVFLALGRKWRGEFEAKGVTYWKAPKETRISELTEGVWSPKLLTIFYGLAYFTNGYMKISFSMWLPLFLLQVRGLSTFDTALFLGLAYVSWQWKMFIGMISDALPIKFMGKAYRRHPWFVASGILSILATLAFILFDLEKMSIWTTFFTVVLMITTAGALFDMAADSYALDVTPPDWHARVLGGVNTIGQAVGGSLACVLTPFLISVGGYRLVFISGGVSGLLAFSFLALKEPELDYERVFSKEAIAFTFTERSVLISSLLMLGMAIGTRRISNPTGGMFSLIMNEVVGGLTPMQAGSIALLTLIAGIPGSVIGGWAADKWGHKRVYTLTAIAMVVSGYLWMSLQKGMVAWFISLAVLSNFIQRLNAGGRMALMGDTTPLALSATVFQMYMSFSWIGNVPASIIIGFLLPLNIPFLFAFLSTFTLIPLILVHFLKPYEAGKGINV